MTVDIKAIQDIIFDWVRDYSIDDCFKELRENHIIWADQDGHQPDSPYITLKLISGPQYIGEKDKLTYDYSNNKYEASGTRTLTLSVNMYGQSAITVLSKLDASLSLPEVREYFRGNEMSPYDNTGVNNLSESLETVFEERANLDVMFYVVSKIKSTVKTIDTVEAPSFN